LARGGLDDLRRAAGGLCRLMEGRLLAGGIQLHSIGRKAAGLNRLAVKEMSYGC
jgi:hypothetical protein